MAKDNFSARTDAAQGTDCQQIVNNRLKSKLARRRLERSLKLSKGDAEIASQTGVPVGMVGQLKRTYFEEWMGFSCRKGGKPSNRDCEKFLWMAMEGYGAGRIAETAGCSADKVRGACRRGFFGYIPKKRRGREPSQMDKRAVKALFFMDVPKETVSQITGLSSEKVGEVAEDSIRNYDSERKKGQKMGWDDLFFIQEALKLGLSQREMARRIHCSPAAVNKRLKNYAGLGIGAFKAENESAFGKGRRRSKPDRYKKEKTKKFLVVLVERVESGDESVWSFCESYEKYGLAEEESLCATTVYNLIRKGLLKIDESRLFRGPLRREEEPDGEKTDAEEEKRDSEKEAKRPVGLPYADLPRMGFDGAEFLIGCYELDTVNGPVGSKKSILTLVELKSHLGMAVLLEGKKARHVNDALEKLCGILSSIDPEIARYVLTDNGTEFANAARIRGLKGKLYCARPYTPTDKPRIERYNQMLRQFFPKGESFDSATQESVRDAARKIALRRVRSLSWCSPWEVFEAGVLSKCGHDAEKAGKALSALKEFFGME